jgi:hypothetical protein
LGIGNPAGLLLISLVVIAAVVVVWVALMIRKMLIIISAVFAPIAFSGAASDVSKSWVRRWIEFTVALVFSKLILIIIFMIGLSVLNGVGEPSGAGGGGRASASQSITNLAVGTLTLLLAGFAPWIAIKMVHFVGDSLHMAHAQAATAGAGARTVVAAPQKVSSSMQRHRALLLGSASTASASAARAGGSATPSKPPSTAAGSSAAGGAAGGASAGAPPAPGVATAVIGAPRMAGQAMRSATEHGIETGKPTASPHDRPPRV